MARLFSALALGLLLLPISTAVAADDDEPTIRGKTLPQWLAILHDDPDPKKRQIAMLIVGQVGPKSKLVLPALLKELHENSDPATRAKCASMLVKFKEASREKLVEPLAGALRDDKEGAVREAAAAALGKLDREAFPTVPALTAALADKHAGTRAAAAETLAQFASIDPEITRSTIPTLIERLKDPEANVRTTAAFALGRMGPVAVDATPALTALLTGEKNTAVLKEAAKTVGAIGPKAAGATTAVAQLLRRPEIDMRQQAAVVLAQLGPDAAAALPDLLVAIKDKEKSVRVLAVHAFGSLGKSALPKLQALINLLKDDDVPEVRLAIIEELGGLGPDAKDAVDALTICARDGRVAIREAAQDALKKIQKTP
ncbi:MAG: HEAT repeat domain-containing protein [Gemmataceae bacterium]